MSYITKKLHELDCKLKDMEMKGRSLEEKIRSGGCSSNVRSCQWIVPVVVTIINYH